MDKVKSFIEIYAPNRREAIELLNDAEKRIYDLNDSIADIVLKISVKDSENTK